MNIANFTTWLSENKRATSLAVLFILGAAILSWLTLGAWENYASVTTEYSAKASQLTSLSKLKLFPNSSNLKKLEATLTQTQSDLEKLRASLEHYRIPPFGTIESSKPQDRPQYFQDALRNQVTEIKSLSGISGSTLPPSFYLGLDDFENRLPPTDQLPSLAKELTVLNAIATIVTTQKGTIVTEFSRIRPSATASNPLASQKNKSTPQETPKAQLPYEDLGAIRINLRCGQIEFHQLIKAFAAAPYFLVIEEIKIQNSAGEPPHRNISTAAPAPKDDQPSDGSTTIQRLPIIVGCESLNIMLQIRIFDFPAKQPSPSQPSSAK
jgi:hypothetical protein